MRFVDLAHTSRLVSDTSRRNEKIAAWSGFLTGVSTDEIPAAVAFGVGTSSHGRLGVGWATLRDVRPAPAAEASLGIGEVDRILGGLAGIAGAGSVERRRTVLDELLARATEPEQEMIRAIIRGELRQGALEGVMAAAVAKAAGVPIGLVQRAAMFSGSLATAAQLALAGGAPALEAVELSPSQPIQPMLASPAASVAEALAASGPASVEWKLDGARIQVHRAAGEVSVFTRNLNDITARLGGVVDLVRTLPGGDLVLDGEVLGIDETGAPRRFQDTMGDFGADVPTGAGSRGDGLRAFFFDVLYVDEPVVDEPLSVRRELLAEVVPPAAQLPSIITADAVEAESFLTRAIEAGHEGVMVKDVTAPYDAGRRGGAWRKVKPVHTFDLVVLAVEWGHGRRSGWLSNLHLGARREDGGFVMVGKTFKGLTDVLLRWQTQRFTELQIGTGTGRESHVVYVRPEQVVEIAVDGVQVSTRYPGGVALRFARVRQYRHDKSAGDADTIEQVQSLLGRPR